MIGNPCRAGDIAEVIDGPILTGRNIRTPTLLGRIVFVERRHINGERVDGRASLALHGLSWIVSSPGTVLPQLHSDGRFYWVKRRVIVDSILRPIRDASLAAEGRDQSALEPA